MSRARLWSAVERVLCALACAGSIAAGAARAQAADDWRAARLSGSDRLFLYSLLRDAPQGSEPVARAILRRLALGKVAGAPPYMAERDVRVAPVLAWDDNVNGGLGFDTFALSGLEFTVAEDSRARGGWTAGIEASAFAAWAVGTRMRMTLGAAVDLRHAPELNLNRADGHVRACVERGTLDWRAWQACATVRGAERANTSLALRRLDAVRIGLASSALGDHEWRAGLWAEDTQGIVQTGVQGALLTARGGLGLVSAHLALGERVEGRMAPRLSTGLSLSRDLLGRPATLSAGWARSDGQVVFGLDRVDRVRRIALRRPVTDRFAATLGWTQRRSSVPGFDDARLSLDVAVTGWGF